MWKYVQICAHTWAGTHIHTPLVSAERAQKHLLPQQAPRTYYLTSPPIKEEISLKKWLVLGLGQGIGTVSLKHLKVSGRTCLKQTQNHHNEGVAKMYRTQWKHLNKKLKLYL